MNIELSSPAEAYAVFGAQDRHLRLLKERFDVSMVLRNGVLKLGGEDASVEAAGGVVRALIARVRANQSVDADIVLDAIDRAQGRPSSGERAAAAAPLEPVKIAHPIEGFRARTAGQQAYLDLIARNEIVFGIGPAGSGKTFLAVLKAVEMLKSGAVHRIILCRPAVEAGERLGFLPGDFHAKVNPYLRPLYDALNEVLDVETVKRLLERETIEIVPLAYMRGRTLNRAFIILDEAQNTTPGQMKMFLTRMGEGSRIVVTGDITQIDLPDPRASGLVHVQRILRPTEGIAFHHMTGKDIVRHKLVWQILQSYERAERDEGKH